MNQIRMDISVSEHDGLVRVSWYSNEQIIKVRYFKEDQITNAYMEVDYNSQNMFTVVVQLRQEHRTRLCRLFMHDIDSAELITRELSRYSNW